jgi:type IV pilus assembly protein PilB
VNQPVQPQPSQVPTTVGQIPALLDEHQEKARSKGWYYVDVSQYEPNSDVLGLMEAQLARNLNVLPVGIKERAVFVAVGDPDNLDIRQRLSPLFNGLTVRLMYADPVAIRRKIDEVYSARDEAQELAGQRKKKSADRSDGGDLGRVMGVDESDNKRLLRLALEQAVREGASDVHFEPCADRFEVRFRVDGKLRVAFTYPLGKAKEITTLIKVDGVGMTPDNFLIPDSGVLQFTPPDSDKPVDIRVECAPTAWGTTTVMRLQTNIWRPLDSLGFSEYNMKRYQQALWQPNGVCLTTGPTGSGKSTTLYASLNERISPEVKIVTLENPVEYKAPSGISQMMMNDAQGMTFSGGLRSILRQDPDIILVGEIRDEETAETAVDAAMTGHLVFSTLHTNDAIGAIPRLGRMGIEPMMLADSLLCVVGQRLLRRLCEHCKIQVPADIDEIIEWGFDADAVEDLVWAPNPAGCLDCFGRGFAGRVPIHEVLLMSEDMKEAIQESAPQAEIARLAIAAGLKTMREDGFEKALQGITSIAEVNANTRRALV